MATKKAAKPAAKKAETLTGKKPRNKKVKPPALYTGDVQAWERNESIECAADESK